MAESSGNNSWVAICGREDDALASELEHLVADRIGRGEFTDPAKRYVEKVSLALVDGSLSLSDKQLEKLRRMCQLWDVDIKVSNITSHRPFIGPVIVALKKAMFPMLRVLLKDFLEQQREFNATTIALCAHLANRNVEDPAE